MTGQWPGSILGIREVLPGGARAIPPVTTAFRGDCDHSVGDGRRTPGRVRARVDARSKRPHVHLHPHAFVHAEAGGPPRRPLRSPARGRVLEVGRTARRAQGKRAGERSPVRHAPADLQVHHDVQANARPRVGLD